MDSKFLNIRTSKLDKHSCVVTTELRSGPHKLLELQSPHKLLAIPDPNWSKFSVKLFCLKWFPSKNPSFIGDEEESCILVM